jgi:threonine dehydrogenase-like Zn-dependent dehydrogenase
MSHLGIWQDGSLAELVRAPAARCTRLPDNLSDAEGALVEVLACGVNLVDKGQIQTGDVVVVVGGGPMGQMAALVAGTAGPEKVIMTELSPQRRTVGERMGVDITIAPESQDPVEAVRELTRGRGADVVL